MKALLRFQSLGHEIKVITQGLYHYSDMRDLFARNGVYISEADYYQRDDINFNDDSKQSFIDSLEFRNEALLIDDQYINKPTHAHFCLSGGRIPFPSFIRITPD